MFRWLFRRKKPDPDVSDLNELIDDLIAADEAVETAHDVTGSTIFTALWECPTKEACNAEKTKLREENEELRRSLVGLNASDD